MPDAFLARLREAELRDAKRVTKPIDARVLLCKEFGCRDVMPIARGAFSEVLRAKLADGRWVAIKRFKSRNENAAVVFRREVEVLHHVPEADAWITGLLEHRVLHDKSMVLVLELGGVSLRQMMATLPSDPKCTRKRARLIEHIVRATRHLHDQLQIAHRDLKPDNMLVKVDPSTDEFHLQLCDFGLAMCCPDGTRLQTICGTPMYMAPELLRRASHGYEGRCVDIWAIGAVVYELLHARSPFRATHALELTNNIRHGRHAPFNPRLHALYRTMITNCLRINPNDRFTAHELRIPLFKPLPMKTPANIRAPRTLRK